MRPLDLTREQQERQDELRRRLSEPQRAAIFAGIWATGRQLAEAGVRHRNPGATEARVRWLLTALLYDEPTALRLHGPKPSE